MKYLWKVGFGELFAVAFLVVICLLVLSFASQDSKNTLILAQIASKFIATSQYWYETLIYNFSAIIGVVEPELSGSHKCIIIGSVVFYIVFIILMIALYVGGVFWVANNPDDFNYNYNYGK